MTRLRHAFWIAAALSFGFTVPRAAFAESETRPIARAIVLEHWMPSGDYEISVSDSSPRTGPGVGLGLWFDFLPWEHLNLGFQVVRIARGGHTHEVSGSSVTHFGVHAGPSWRIGERFMFGISGVLGWQILSFDDADALSFGTGAGVLGDLAFRVLHGFWISGQVGWLAQPFGGNDATDIHVPLSFVGGLGFALVLER